MTKDPVHFESDVIYFWLYLLQREFQAKGSIVVHTEVFRAFLDRNTIELLNFYRVVSHYHNLRFCFVHHEFTLLEELSRKIERLDQIMH